MVSATHSLGLTEFPAAHRIARDRGKMGVEFFFQLLELGYGKFPHNTTG